MFGLLLSLGLAATVQTQQWTAQPLLQVGEDEGISFGAIADLAVAPDGRFFVLDRAESRVYVFSADGKLERSFGRRGAGPGELSNLTTALVYTQGQLLVVDASNQRLSLFAADGSFVRSRQLNFMQGMPVSWAATGARVAYLARPMPAPVAAQLGGVSSHTVFSIDPRTDAAADTLLRIPLPPDNTVMMGGATIKATFDMRAPQIYVAGDGLNRVLIAVSDTYRIRVLGADGKTIGWLNRDVPRRRYTKAELVRMKQQTDSMMQAGLRAGMSAAGAARNMPAPQFDVVMPEFAHALTALIANERLVLVARSSNRVRAPSEWDVLSYDNRLAGSLTLPAGFRPFALLNDRLYGVAKDELDVESVVVYRIGAKR
jgi:hypothetical protein